MRKTIHIKGDLQRQTLAGLAQEIPDGHVVKIAPEKDVRRTEHNAYYWGGVLKPMCDHYGYTKRELHFLMKKIYLHPIMLAIDDEYNAMIAAVRDVYKAGGKPQALYMMEGIYKLLTTTRLTTKQFYEYVEAVKEHALNDNIKLQTKEEYEGLL